MAERFEPTPHAVRLGQSCFRRLGRLVCTAGILWRHSRREAVLSDRFETHEHDVLIIGAGGAGLRAAIEALGQGASVGVVCKSLLGKAHTVMAEGGIAAAMANVDADDDWRTHFRDTMRAGTMPNDWRMPSNAWEYTGDGMALAYEAGAELMDMEFVQFHPTGMVWPPGVQGILVTEAVRGEGGTLRNKTGERFMERYDSQRMELSTRDVVARSIYTEVKEGRGTEHGGAYLDISHKPSEYVKKKLPSMYHQFKELADVDITKGP